MKARYFFALMIGVLMQGCNADDSPSAKENFLQQLQGEWTLTSGQVKADGRDVTNSFVGMKITIGKTMDYKVVYPVSPIWPEAGTFTLEENGNGLFDLLRNDGTRVIVSSLTKETVEFSLQYTPVNGRLKEIGGEFIFVMNKQD